MMDKKKYYPLAMMSGLTIRGILYPLTLIRTRLQVQDGRTVYNGTNFPQNVQTILLLALN
jgi:solute carrier family 25 protein 44